MAILIESATNDHGVRLADLLDNKDLTFTLFAPDNNAISDKLFTQWLAKPNGQELVWVLYSHMVTERVVSASLGASQMIQTRAGVGVLVTSSATGCKFGDAVITKADIVATNGVLHVISGPALTPQRTLFGRIQANPQLQTLTRLLLVAGLADDINNFNDGAIDPLADDDDSNKPARSWKGTVKTIFAPTDAAFGALASSQLKLLEDPFNKEQLVRLLRYHFLKGSYQTSILNLEDPSFKVSTEAAEIGNSMSVTILRSHSGKVSRAI
jgi:uncharacterized surface protein with fasciclin (FAS1) repeats